MSDAAPTRRTAAPATDRRRSVIRRGRSLAAVLGAALMLASCSSGSAGTATSAAGGPQVTGDLGIQTPNLEYPCSLFATADIAVFIPEPELDEVYRSGRTGEAYGCRWTAADGTVSFAAGQLGRVSAAVLESGSAVEDLGDQAAYRDAEAVLPGGADGVERTLVVKDGDRAVTLAVTAADPSTTDMVAVSALIRARMTTVMANEGSEGDAQLGPDRVLCENVVADWERTYSVLAGTAQVVSSVSTYTTGLVEWGAEKVDTVGYPDLKTAVAGLAAADPANVDAVRAAVEQVGRTCQQGGVTIGWLPAG